MYQTSESRRRIMRSVRNRDTAPELFVRSLVHRMGYRFTTCRQDLPGKPDIVFTRRRKVIFVHGCFWHRHDCGRGIRVPQNNHEFWSEKLATNARRDTAAQVQLRALGWEVAILWECQLRDEKRVKKELRVFLGPKCKRLEFPSGVRPILRMSMSA